MVTTAPDASELVTNYFNLARKIAGRWASRYPHLAADFESAAVYDLWRTATAFDPDRGTKFATVFHARCHFAMLKVVKKEYAKSPPSFGAQFVPSTEQDTHPLDRAPAHTRGPAELAELDDDVTNLPALLAVLPEGRRALVVRHIAHGETYTDLAADYGTTRSDIRGMVGKALKKLRGNRSHLR
ncbi:MAG: hypothetical protein C0467_07095 [Planctomycetaceae bacterium]|nr:hypothetical protein [Planctomycetaceae bacterium]